MRMGEFFSKQGQMLAMQARISTDSMHIMSLKSRREAVSMHVITIWTLIFLPGTFVAVGPPFSPSPPSTPSLTQKAGPDHSDNRHFSAVVFSILPRYGNSGTGAPVGSGLSYSLLYAALSCF